MIRLVVGVCLLVALSLTRGQGAIGEGTIALDGSIRPVAQTGGDGARPFLSREKLTESESDAALTIEIVFEMRNFAGLQARLAQGVQVTPVEMAHEYEPRGADYASVAEWVSAQGLEITRRDPHHLSLFVCGTVGQISRVFQMQFARVVFNGRDYTGAISPPKVPAKFEHVLKGINGLQPWMGRH